MVACPATVPGTDSRIAGMASLVVVMANMPRRKANASGGDIVYVKGSMIASAVIPPSPGTAPKKIPIKTPSKR